MSFSKQQAPSQPPLAAALSSLRGAALGIGAVSGVVNLLALTGSFFMLQVYDRVIPGRSLPTLAGLAIVAGTLFAFQGILELLRSKLLVRIGLAVDQRLSGRIYRALMQLPLKTRLPGDGLQSIRDLDQVRGFLSSAGPTALFDLPWMPLYIGICFAFHVWIGVTALAGAILLIAVTALTEVLSRRPARVAASHATERSALAEATRRNAEALAAMGFGHRIAERWLTLNARYLEAQTAASDVVGTLATISKVARMMLQSGVLAVGAILVIRQEATGGIMIASSILTSRALAPVDLAIAHWKGFVAARQSFGRLAKLLALLPSSAISVSLPAPMSSLTVEAIAVAPPGGRVPVVQQVTFQLQAGSALGIIGPSASGKSSLARALTGVWTPVKGSVRLDRATLDQWHPEELGRHIGYVPQDVALFDGTIAENIARFDAACPSDTILAAAKAAGVYDMIVQMPDGFETQIGEHGSVLSAGQRQRIALARALYDDPFLVVLDEPNSNLDADGEAALASAIAGIRRRGGIAIVIAHRPSALAAVDQVLVMAAGQMQAFGPKEEVLRKVMKPATGLPGPIRIVSGIEETAS